MQPCAIETNIEGCASFYSGLRTWVHTHHRRVSSPSKHTRRLGVYRLRWVIGLTARPSHGVFAPPLVDRFSYFRRKRRNRAETEEKSRAIDRSNPAARSLTMQTLSVTRAGVSQGCVPVSQGSGLGTSDGQTCVPGWHLRFGA